MSKLKNETEQGNLVLDTSGGEIPNTDRKVPEKASDAAEAFKADEEKKSEVKNSEADKKPLEKKAG